MADLISVGIDNSEPGRLQFLWLDSLDDPCPVDLQSFTRAGDFEHYWESVMERFSCRLRVSAFWAYHDDPLDVTDWLSQRPGTRLDLHIEAYHFTAFTVEATRLEVPSAFRVAYALALCGLYRNQVPSVVDGLLRKIWMLHSELRHIEDTLARLLNCLPGDGGQS